MHVANDLCTNANTGPGGAEAQPAGGVGRGRASAMAWCTHAFRAWRSVPPERLDMI